MGNAWSFPTSLNVGGVDYEIRTDYRAVLDLFTALNDPELQDESEELTAYAQTQFSARSRSFRSETAIVHAPPQIL